MINKPLWEQYMYLADQLLIPRTSADVDYLGEPQELVCKVLRRAGLACGQPEFPTDSEAVIKAVDLAVIGLPSEEQNALLLMVDALVSEIPWPLQLWSRTVPPQELLPDEAKCVGVFRYGLPGDLGPWPPERMDPQQAHEVELWSAGTMRTPVLNDDGDNEEDDEDVQ